MTITLEIPAEMELVLGAKAERFGLALPEYIFSLCEVAADDDYSLSLEEISIVQERITDREAGNKGILLEDWWAEVLAKRAARADQLSDGNLA
jgi:hypothetical protein